MSDDPLTTHTTKTAEPTPETTNTAITTTLLATTTPPSIEKPTKRIVVLTNNNTNTNFGHDKANSSMAQGTSLVKIKIAGVDVVTPKTGQLDKPKSVGKITIQAVNRSLSSGAEVLSDVVGSPDETTKSDPSKTTYVIKKPHPEPVGEKLGIATSSKEVKLVQQPLVSVATAKNKIIMVKMLPSYKAAEPRADTTKPQEDVLLETSTMSRVSVVTESVADSSTSSEPPVVNDEEAGASEEVSSSKEPLTIKISGIAATNAPASANSPKISRDLKALKRSQDNSKILTEFITEINQDGKARKSRKTNGGDDDSLSSRSRSLSRGPVHRERSESTDRGRITPSAEEKVSPSRRANMRSANSEFSLKQKKFLNQIAQNDENTDNSDNESTITSVTNEPKEENNGAVVDGDVDMVPKAIHPPPKPGWDKFCWRCHQDGEMVACSKCIRSFHVKCLKANQMVADMAEWACPECLDIEMGETKEKGKYKKEKLSVDDLNRLLGFALKRFKQLKGCDTLHKLITKSQHGDYEDYIEKNVDLKFMEQRVVHTPYHSTDEFLSDCKWILHNTIVYPHLSRHILAAKSLVRQCKMEMTEIDTCPECYENANTKKNWFVEVCSRPHILLWAKLKGFPYWPAKAMATNASLVDVRFFGKHDKAWLPVKDCFLYSAEDPNQPKRYKNNNIAECIKEVDVHLEKLEARFGKFNTSLFRVNYNPAWETKQWCELLPLGRKELLNTEPPAKTDLKMKIYKTADNNLSISKVEAKATSNGVSRRRPSGDSPTKSPAQPPNKIKILERHTSDGKNKTYQIMKEVGAQNKTAPPANQVAAATTNKLEPVKLKRKFDSWSNSSKEPAEKKLRMNEEEKAKKEEVGEAKMPSPAKEPTKTPEAPVVVSNATEKQTPVESPPNKRVTRNQQSFTEAPAAKSDRTTRRSKTISKDNEEATTPDAETTAPENNGLLTRSRRKSLGKGQEPAQTSSPAKTNGKETTVVTASEKSKETDKSSESLVASAAEADSGVLQIKEEPISDDEATPATSTNVTMNSDNFTTSTPASTPVAKPNVTERIMVKDLAQLTTAAKNKSQSPFAAQRRYGQLKTEPASPGVALRKSSPSQRARKTFPHRSRFHAPAYTQTTARFGSLSTNAIKQPNNMVYIPMSTMNFAALANDVPPLAAVSKVSQFKTTSNARVGGTAAAVTTTPIEQQLAATQQPQTVPQKSVPPLVAPLPVITSAATLVPPATNPPLLQPLTEQLPQKQLQQQPQHMLSGYMSEGLAAAITETISNAPPKLTCRPTGALRSDGDAVYPSEAGPISRILIDNSHKMADFFRSVIEDTLADLSNNGQPEARIRLLEAEIEKLKHAHAQEVATLKHNSDLVIGEMRKSLESERGRLVNEIRKQCELERIRAVEETKKKQWCTNCGKEAQFHCCWNTSYCDYPCQEQHWQRHMTSCNQLQQQQQQQIMQVQQHQQQQQMLNKSKETLQLQRPGPGYHGPVTVQLPSTPPTGVAPTRLNVHNAAPKPATATANPSPFYTIVQNRQNGKWEMVSTKPNSMTNGSGSAFVGITTAPIATTSPSLAVATPVVGNFPALIQLSANDPSLLLASVKKTPLNKPN